jgi:O-antigen ligase
MSMLVFTPGPESPKLALRLTVIGAVGWVVLSAVGAMKLIQERLYGDASRPASIAQRAGVLGSALDIWRRRPLQGYGFGTYLEEIFAQGFVYSNTENEYVNFLLSGGIIAFGAWALIGIRGVVLAFRARAFALMPTVGGLIVAWLVNVGTYNAFSWSVAFPAFMTILAIAADGADA